MNVLDPSNDRDPPVCASHVTVERWTRRGVITVLLCALAGAIDSFDTQMVGFTGRLIALDLRFAPGLLGWLFGAGQFGGVIGAVFFGSLADRFGRVRILVVTCFLAAFFTAASLRASDYETLLACRALTGVGLGGVLPCFLGLGVEAMPARRRLALTPVLYAVFPVGGILGAWISAPVMTAYGWRGVFAFGAGALATVGILTLALPIVRYLPADRARAGQVSALFAEDRAGVTAALWALFLLAPSGVYLLILWMPPLLQLSGLSPGRTSLLVGIANCGALVFALGGGWVMERLGYLRTLAPVLFVGALSFGAMALVHRDLVPSIGVAIVAGAALGGSMSLLVTMVATAYPSEIRATGIGWALGVARVGQMSAPIPIGMLVNAGVSPLAALIACGVPPLLSLIPLIAVIRALRARASRTAI